MDYREHLNIFTYEDATIIPTAYKDGIKGMYDCKGRYVFGSGKRKLGGPHLYYPALEESSELEVTDIEETVVYIGFLMSHYGHMITDGSICLWGLFELPSNLPIAYIPEGSVLPKHYIELFKLLGINTDRFLEIHSPVRFQKVYFPELSYDVDHYVSPYFSLVFKKAIAGCQKQNQGVSVKSPEKIYLSRVAFSRQNRLDNYGEKIIEKIFEQNGYAILYPDQLSVPQKILAFSKCKVLVSGNGTSAHNVVWCNDSLQRLVILEKFQGGNGHQDAIDLGYSYQTIKIPVYQKKSRKHLYFITITRELKNYCEDNQLSIRLDFKEWCYHIKEYFVFCRRRLQTILKIRTRIKDFWAKRELSS